MPSDDGTGRPLLVGDLVTVRPGSADHVDLLVAIVSEASVRSWWGEPESHTEIEAKLLRPDDTVLLVLEVDGEVAGGIEYHEVDDPMYRHAGIDIYLGTRHQDAGRGTEAVALLVRFLIDGRGHHRVTIDLALANTRAIRSYEKVVPAGRGDAPLRAWPRRRVP